MKLTKEQLLQIVQEELFSILKESDPPWIRKRREKEKDRRIPLYVPQYREPPDEEEEEEEEARRGTTYISGGNIPSSNIPEGKMFKFTKSQIKKIIREEMLGIIRESGGDSWRSRERNAGEEWGEEELSRIPDEKIQSDYEKGFSHWITRQIINKEIDREDLDNWMGEWNKVLNRPGRQLEPDAIERIISQGIADAFEEEPLPDELDLMGAQFDASDEQMYHARNSSGEY